MTSSLATIAQSPSPLHTQRDCPGIRSINNMITGSRPENTAASAGLPRATRRVLPVLLLGRVYFEKPVHGFGSSGQHGPQLAPVDNLGSP